MVDHRQLTRVPAAPPSTFTTERLSLRRPQLADASTIYESYAADADVTKYLNWKPHGSVEDTYRFLQRCIDAWGSGEGFTWVATRTVDRRIIGMIECRIDAHGANLGYVVSKAYWNDGYATEIVRALVKWAMSSNFVHRVWAYCDVENAASARVLEKVGFRREGLLRKWVALPNMGETPRDCNCYAIVK